MKVFRENECPYLYDVINRTKKGELIRNLYNRCRKIGKRCVLATTSHKRVKINSKKCTLVKL